MSPLFAFHLRPDVSHLVEQLICAVSFFFKLLLFFVTQLSYYAFLSGRKKPIKSPPPFAKNLIVITSGRLGSEASYKEIMKQTKTSVSQLFDANEEAQHVIVDSCATATELSHSAAFSAETLPRARTNTSQTKLTDRLPSCLKPSSHLLLG